MKDLVKRIHEMAKSKGRWDKEVAKTPVECHMLMVTEIAEATEEVRKGTPDIYGVYGDRFVSVETVELNGGILKPEGEAVELADCVIRIMDYFGYKGWDLERIIKLKMDYNVRRGFRHGGKKL